MGYVDNTGLILGAQESRLAASNNPEEHSATLDQDAFMTILIAQLTHQDPLNPMADTEIDRKRVG